MECEIDRTDGIEPKSHDFTRAKVTKSGSQLDIPIFFVLAPPLIKGVVIFVSLWYNSYDNFGFLFFDWSKII